ncbi:MAG TPA: helix-turn-helix domain-containing protein [Micromonosporaceae bacterium]
MAGELYSVDQVAERLGLHVRTVRNYVRDGRLKAVRIGKQYRIAEEDLAALTGRRVAPARPRVGPERPAEVTTIVQIEAITPDQANRVSNTLVAAAGGDPASDQPLRVQTGYDEQRSSLKVVILGGLHSSAELLRLIAAITGADR